MHLNDYLNRKELDQLVEDGFASKRKHNSLDLYIYNYTKKASGISKHHWSDALSKARGLIVAGDDKVVATGQPKFWNYTDGEDEIRPPFKVYDKLDGSLGIVYRYKGYMGVATRGSFHSEQAEWATEFLSARPGRQNYFDALIANGWTPHVEIIYSDNRIVVEYDYEDLVLLGIQQAYCDDLYGVEVLWHVPEGYPGPTTQEFEFASVQDMLDAEPRDNTEGYIIQDCTGAKFKIKYDQYITLHRAIFNMTPKNLYALYVDDLNKLEDYLLALPNELQPEARAIVGEFAMNELAVARQLDDYMQELKVAIKKDFAIKMNELNIPSAYRGGLFTLWDGDHKRAARWVQGMIKP